MLVYEPLVFKVFLKIFHIYQSELRQHRTMIVCGLRRQAVIARCCLKIIDIF